MYSIINKIFIFVDLALGIVIMILLDDYLEGLYMSLSISNIHSVSSIFIIYPVIIIGCLEWIINYILKRIYTDRKVKFWNIILTLYYVVFIIMLLYSSNFSNIINKIINFMYY